MLRCTKNTLKQNEPIKRGLIIALRQLGKKSLSRSSFASSKSKLI